MLRTRLTWLLAAAPLAASIALVAACSSDDPEPEVPASLAATEAAAPTATNATTDTMTTASVAATNHAEATASGILAALFLTETVGFHDIDDALNGATPAIEASWLGATNNARTAVAALTWPADLADHAAALVAAAGDLATTLEADDAGAAAPLATAAHDAHHHLNEAAWDYVAGHPDSATMSEPHTAGMLAALAVIDGVGLHDINEGLNGDAPAIEASWLGSTRHAATAASSVIWPPALTEAAAVFVAATNDLAIALEADDAAAAGPLAAAAHKAQQELSHDGYEAVQAMAASMAQSMDAMAIGDDHTDTAGILVSLMLADRVGFHDIDDALNGDAPAIEASWLGAVINARIAAATTHWPADLRAGAATFVTAATELAASLEAGDAAGAATHAAAAHDAQHDLSGDAYAHLASVAGLDGAVAADGHDHQHTGATVEAPEGLSLAARIEAQPGAIAITVDASGLTIVTPASDTPFIAGEGHIHVTVDGVEVGMFFGPDIVLSDVPPGMHEVVVGLSTNTHESYARAGVPIEVTTMVEVPAP